MLALRIAADLAVIAAAWIAAFWVIRRAVRAELASRQIERLEVLELRDGDLLVVRTPANLSRDEMARISDSIRTPLRARYPGLNIAITPYEFAVVRPEGS